MDISEELNTLYKKAFNEGYKAGVIDSVLRENGISPEDLETYNKAKEITDKIFKESGMGN